MPHCVHPENESFGQNNRKLCFKDILHGDYTLNLKGNFSVARTVNLKYFLPLVVHRSKTERNGALGFQPNLS